MDKGIYFIHFQKYHFFNNTANGIFINSLGKFNDNFILGGEWVKDKNEIIVLYFYVSSNIVIEYNKFKAYGNSVSFVIINGKIVIFCSTAKNICCWELIEFMFFMIIH